MCLFIRFFVCCCCLCFAFDGVDVFVFALFFALALFPCLMYAVVFVRLLFVIVTVLLVKTYFAYYSLFMCVVIFLPFRDAPPFLLCFVVFVCHCWPLFKLSF